MIEEEEELAVWEGLEDALIGIGQVLHDGDAQDRLIYSGDDILHILITRDGMDFEGAMEFIQLNIENAYIGPTTPIIMWEVPDEIVGGSDD